MSHADTELIPLVPNSLKREIWKEEVYNLLKNHMLSLTVVKQHLLEYPITKLVCKTNVIWLIYNLGLLILNLIYVSNFFDNLGSTILYYQHI